MQKKKLSQRIQKIVYMVFFKFCPRIMKFGDKFKVIVKGENQKRFLFIFIFHIKTITNF